ncbi:unnamed protein product [Lymnaea stagnalis]|uniref:NEDD8 ultimate buster 1 n=1 Tax=Lymnaea stagnalis TaxID=6523 RepID=A0AAV2HQG4_LYMST
MENLSRDLLLKQLRDHLNNEKIKLWMPPFTNEKREKGEIPEELISRYAEVLRSSRDEIAQGLEDLRLRAISKLVEREKFQNLGVATLRVKLTGSLATERNLRKLVPVECRLDITGADLRALVSTKYELNPTQLKLISGGRVIEQNTSLNSQGIKNGSDIMAMFISTTDAKLAEKEAEIAEIEKTRWAAEILSSRADDDEDFDIQVADQKGNPLNLPSEEKKALTMAMTLHEKGRAALKSKKVSLALPLFLEADAEFSKCRAQILNSVDNYAILCLDIVWCYLVLQNLEQLPDAGKGMAVIYSVFQGGTGTEQALFMRLYLLQGIVAFHKGDITNSLNLFRRAEFVLNLLHVDENKLQEIMLMGFTEREARLGLRAKNGNIPQAVAYIVEKKREEEEVNKKAKKEWRQRVRGKKLGKTAGGEPVNVEYFDTLVGMDFPSGAAAEALRQANNDISQAIEILNTKPELLHLPDPEKSMMEITDAMIERVCTLGFNVDMAKKSLELFRGNIQRAVEELLKYNGNLPSPSTSASSVSDSSMSSIILTKLSFISDASFLEDPKRRLGKKEKEELNSLVSDINTDANDHLDLTLSEEREYLLLYQNMIDNMPISSNC